MSLIRATSPFAIAAAARAATRPALPSCFTTTVPPRLVPRTAAASLPLNAGRWNSPRLYATRIVHPSDRKPVSPEGQPMFLTIDPTAVKQLQKIYTVDGNPSQALRVLVEAGGCHGFQYKLDLVDAKQIAEDDVLFDNDGAKLVIDETSLELVNGSKLVFADELIGQEFRLVDNPNAGSSCGCGTSFEVKF